jgi:hypothetical protein
MLIVYTHYMLYCLYSTHDMEPSNIKIIDMGVLLRFLLAVMYEGHLESKERWRIQPAQLFQCS